MKNFLHCTALGKALLAYSPENLVTDVIKDHGLPEKTEHTITDEAALRADLVEIVRRGYSLDLQEGNDLIRCVGVAIRDISGNPVAALSVSGPTGRMTDDRMTLIGARLVKVAGTIQKTIGKNIPTK